MICHAAENTPSPSPWSCVHFWDRTTLPRTLGIACRWITDEWRMIFNEEEGGGGRRDEEVEEEENVVKSSLAVFPPLFALLRDPTLKIRQCLLPRSNSHFPISPSAALISAHSNLGDQVGVAWRVLPLLTIQRFVRHARISCVVYAA
eukprot:767934-Hanusia_phi.AAC.4